jgi:hypothetical protein
MAGPRPSVPRDIGAPRYIKKYLLNNGHPWRLSMAGARPSVTREAAATRYIKLCRSYSRKRPSLEAVHG